MKFFKYITVGILFGITMVKSEAASWFRIYEMFQFQSFHMYGILGVAVIVGLMIVQLMRRGIVKDIHGDKIVIPDKNRSVPRYLIGGIIFGMGWALAGVCPGPMFVLLGAGYTVFAVFLAAAMLGTFLYGVLRKHLPH